MRLADDEFLSRVGHDFRGELATMVAGVHFLLRYDRQLGASTRQMLERVGGAGQRLKHLLDEFDDAAWVDGRAASRIDVEPASLFEIVRGTLARLAPVAEYRGVRVELAHAPDAPTAACDPELVGVAVAYVLDCSIARSIGKRIAVAVAREGKGVAATFEDQGGPVDDEVRERLLEPFVEKEVMPRSAEAPRRERLGLGLAIARGILEAHRGALRVEPRSEGLALVALLPSA